MPVSYIPEGYRSLTPCLPVAGAAKLIDFVKAAFDAEEVARYAMPDGKIAHAVIRIGDSLLEAGDANEQWPPLPTALHLYVRDTDSTYRRAIEAGAVTLREPANMFYGERAASVKDPTGNYWHIATRVEDLSPEELDRRAKSAAAQC